MTDPAHRTESLKDYAAMLGSPDPTTTGRMRARLEQYMHDRRARRRRVLAAVVIALVLGGIVAAIVAITPRSEHATIVQADDEPRVFELGGARIELQPGASVRTAEHDDARLELVAGEIDAAVPAERSFVVQSGAFEVRAMDARIRVRHTADVPVVTVVRGEAELRGPGLPASGIRVLESP